RYRELRNRDASRSASDRLSSPRRHCMILLPVCRTRSTIMTKSSLLLATVAALLASLPPTPARALTDSETWVSGAGDDMNTVNLCRRTAPCKTFGAALSVTTDGGIVSCLDPSITVGPLNIAQSVTIDCRESQGLVFTTGNGINITASGISVVLKGLSIYS